MLGEQEINLVQQYKYLGILLDEHMKFDKCDKLFGQSAGRALSSLIGQYNAYKNFDFNIFTHLFNSCIAPVMLYGSEACGSNKFPCCDKIQHRAMRFFLGVHKYAPILGLHGEMGWVSLSVHRRVSMARFWNRLVNMDNSRLTKRIFVWDYQINNKNWSSQMNIIFDQSENTNAFNNIHECNIDQVFESLSKEFASYWQEQIQHKPKLRTYVTFKHDFATEPYVRQTLSKSRRSLMTQMRLGILPLEIEVGRFTPIYDKTLKKNRKRIPSERVCTFCDLKTCEDEIHFVFICSKYDEIRKHILGPQLNNIAHMSNQNKLIYIMQNQQQDLIAYLKEAWFKRQISV